jgi:hypothetical protein
MICHEISEIHKKLLLLYILTIVCMYSAAPAELLAQGSCVNLIVSQIGIFDMGNIYGSLANAN